MTGSNPAVNSETHFLCGSIVQQCRLKVIGGKTSTKTAVHDTNNGRTTAAVQASVKNSLSSLCHQIGVIGDNTITQHPPHWSQTRQQRWST